MIDLSYANAAVVLPKDYKRLRVVQIGAGGTGSFAAPAIARLLFELRERTGKGSEFLIVDPDAVERGNIPRSNFCFAEVGRNKAQCLAERISLAWGMEVSYSPEEFSAATHAGHTRYEDLTILVGCVDNHLARREINAALASLNGPRSEYSDAPDAWWIDSGNGRGSGQVLIGSETEGAEDLKPAFFPSARICRRLPGPAVVHPELLTAESELLNTDTTCADRIRLAEQGLNINQRCAIEIAELLDEFLLTAGLKRYAAYFDLDSGTGRSLYATRSE